jgi:CMP-N,N'-diacetyllegionaminic acid synthase
MKMLILIPARAGSKGLTGKNVKILGNLPLIVHTILFAKQIVGPDDQICISTNDNAVIEIARTYGLSVPFVRPEVLASDTAGSYDVIMHAINYYKNIHQRFDSLLLLQPTSPFRIIEDFHNLKTIYNEGCDMAVSVSVSKNNPYFNLFEEDVMGYLMKSKESDAVRRQDCPEVYEYNGSFYLIDVKSLIKSNIKNFSKIRKYVMPEERSIDIDDMKDWQVAEYFLNESLK